MAPRPASPDAPTGVGSVDGQTANAIGTNGYVSSWGALHSGCPLTER